MKVDMAKDEVLKLTAQALINSPSTVMGIMEDVLDSAEKQISSIRQSIRDIYSEVNCRIEHGAESGGHLEYVQEKLKEMLNK